MPEMYCSKRRGHALRSTCESGRVKWAHAATVCLAESSLKRMPKKGIGAVYEAQGLHELHTSVGVVSNGMQCESQVCIMCCERA